MGEVTGISWTDHTFNPWIGCTKVGAPCDLCYAEHLMEHRMGRAIWGGPGKGAGTRSKTSPSNWAQPRRWDRKAAAEGRRAFVFCASLADVFDNEADPAWRAELFTLIRQTPHLVWLLLTKRPQNILKMSREAGGLPPNAALGATIAVPGEVRRDAAHLCNAAHFLEPVFSFVSAEPLLGDIAGELAPFLGADMPGGITWVIAGGESGQAHQEPRPCHPDWIRRLLDVTKAKGCAFHFKQWGEWAPFGNFSHRPRAVTTLTLAGVRDGPGRDFTTWTFHRAGKEEAGHDLDGRTWKERPEVAPVLA